MARLTNVLLEKGCGNYPPPVLDLEAGGIPGYCPPEGMAQHDPEYLVNRPDTEKLWGPDWVHKFNEEVKRMKETSEPKVPSL